MGGEGRHPLRCGQNLLDPLAGPGGWVNKLLLRMIAMAITQIHTHQRNRHGSWRDGEGGALDASRPSDPQVDGSADAAAPTESSKSDDKPSPTALVAAVRRSVSLEDVSFANDSARSGTQRPCPRLA